MRRKVNYLRTGGDTVIRTDAIIGIFDMDNTTTSRHTVAFLNAREREGRIVYAATDIPATFVVTDRNVYLVQPPPRSLRQRVFRQVFKTDDDP